jgi:hypothetical protein
MAIVCHGRTERDASRSQVRSEPLVMWQQNTFTARLTPRMLDEVLARAVELARQR